MRARGFTLIEVLVALAIVALGMAALMGAMTSAADTTIAAFADLHWDTLSQLV